MRLTYKKLASIVSEKLKSLGIEHDSVVAYFTRYRSIDYEGGAAIINYRIFYGDNETIMYGFQWFSEIKEIVKGKYSIQIFPKDRFTITDGEIRFAPLPTNPHKVTN